jgi:hypothetical protein
VGGRIVEGKEDNVDHPLGQEELVGGVPRG